MESLWIYNGLDCAVTHEIAQIVVPMAEADASKTYDFQRALQGPALEMMLRGIFIDEVARQSLIEEFEARADYLQKILDRYTDAIWGEPLNPQSPQQLQAILYEWMGFPTEYKIEKGKRKPSTDRSCLEKLSEKYRLAEPLVAVILGIKDNKKTLQVLRKGVDRDGSAPRSISLAPKPVAGQVPKTPLGPATIYRIGRLRSAAF